MDKKIAIVGSGLNLTSIAEKLNLDAKDVVVVDDIDMLKSEYHKEAVYKYERLPEIHSGWAGDLTKKQLNAPEAELVRSTPKIQNNEPCPCGSGKKYKKCCK